MEFAGEARVFLLQQSFEAVEFEGESLESGAVVGAERFRGKRALGEGASGAVEGGLDGKKLLERAGEMSGAAMVAQGSDEGVDGGDRGGVRRRGSWR
jgi:hypothetical protein